MTAEHTFLFLACLLAICALTTGLDKAYRLYRYVRVLRRANNVKRWTIIQQRILIAQLESRNALLTRALAKKKATGLYLSRGQAG